MCVCPWGCSRILPYWTLYFQCDAVEHSTCVITPLAVNLKNSIILEFRINPSLLFVCLFPVVWIWLHPWFFPRLSPSIFLSICFFFPLALSGVPSLQALAEGYSPLNHSIAAAPGLDLCGCILAKRRNHTLFPAFTYVFAQVSRWILVMMCQISPSNYILQPKSITT